MNYYKKELSVLLLKSIYHITLWTALTYLILDKIGLI